MTVEQHGEVMTFRGSRTALQLSPSMPTAATKSGR